MATKKLEDEELLQEPEMTDEEKFFSEGDWIGNPMDLYKKNNPSGSSGSSGSRSGSSGYNSKYGSQMDSLLNGYLNREKFTYDPESDPLYQNYKNLYTINGQKAMEDTLAEVSARTGGLASSYAGTVSQQAYNDYMSQLSAKIPELYQLAYGMYNDEGNRMLNNINLLNGLDNTEYGRWQDARNFDYQSAIDDRNYNLQLDRYNYSDTQDTKQDAMSRIQAYLSAGGSSSALDSELVKASGYTQPELTQLEAYYKLQNMPTGGSGGGRSGGGYSMPSEALTNIKSMYKSGDTDGIADYLNRLVNSGIISEDTAVYYATVYGVSARGEIDADDLRSPSEVKQSMLANTALVDQIKAYSDYLNNKDKFTKNSGLMNYQVPTTTKKKK